MSKSNPKPNKRPASYHPVKSSPKPEAPGGANGQVAPEFNSIFQALDLIAQRVVVELEKPPQVVAKNWRRYPKIGWTKFVKFAKDVGPFFIGLGSIFASLMIAFNTYTFNKEQAITNRLIEKTAAVADFTEDEKKRNVAAVKLAAYGMEAFPYIKVALGVDDPNMREGGVQTLQIMYQTQPDIRARLLTETTAYFNDKNQVLSYGALKFYSAIAPELSEDKERPAFVQQLKSHFGVNAGSCGKDTGDFVLQAVMFLATCRLNDVRQLLLDIAQNCPHEGSNTDYDGARMHAVNMLAEMIEKQHLPKPEREAIVNTLRGLKDDTRQDVNASIDQAITKIEGSKDP